MATMSDDPTATPASIAMDEAIEFNITTGRMLYPDGSVFINADWPTVGRLIAEAADEGKAVVLCYEDGTRRIVEARPAPTAA
jgi:hypothetical protein